MVTYSSVRSFRLSQSFRLVFVKDLLAPVSSFAWRWCEGVMCSRLNCLVTDDWGYYCLWKAVNNANRIEQTTCRADRIIHREMGQRDANGNLVKRCGLFLALLLRKQVQIASVMSTSRDATSMVDYTNSAGTQVP